MHLGYSLSPCLPVAGRLEALAFGGRKQGLTAPVSSQLFSPLIYCETAPHSFPLPYTSSLQTQHVTLGGSHMQLELPGKGKALMSPPAPRTTEIFTSCVPISETNAKIALSGFRKLSSDGCSFWTALLTNCTSSLLPLQKSVFLNINY